MKKEYTINNDILDVSVNIEIDTEIFTEEKAKIANEIFDDSENRYEQAGEDHYGALLILIAKLLIRSQFEYDYNIKGLMTSGLSGSLKLNLDGSSGITLKGIQGINLEEDDFEVEEH